MKLYLMLLPLLAISLALQAQVPQKFNYQAVVRSNAGTIVANQNIRIRFRIHDGSAAGTVQYSETHNTTTNIYGLINLQVGAGTVASGTFAGVSWNTGNKFLEVETDITGGTNYTSIATVELISVPYAVQADNANRFNGNLAGDVSGAQNNTLIQPSAVTTAKLADNSITAAKVVSNAINTNHIADNSVTSTKIAANAVNTAQIADNAVTAIKIADNAVTATKVAAGSINTTHVADNSVTSTKIATNAVNTTQIVDNAVTAVKIADNAVTATKISASSINTTHLTDNTVTSTKIADNAITSAKIATGTLVKSINGLKDDIVLATGTGISVTTTGNTITLTGQPGDVTGVTAGAGLTGGGATGAITLAANFGGNGTNNFVSRSDHNHVGQSWTANSGTVLTLVNTGTTGSVIRGYSNGTDYNAAALAGVIQSSTGSSVAVYGSTNSSDRAAAAVFGQATNAGGAKAVWGQASGSNTIGIYGLGTGANAWAGYFDGNVHVNGTLSKAAGSFKIDHPLDPANKYLSHSFVESPDMMNIYNGNETLDGNGEATITLPNWFETLNKDFRYQLTAIGKPSPNIYIAQEIAGNKFRIAGGAPGGKISWLVTGVRHDAYANAHRIPVEEPKPVNEKGTYLNPQVLGKSSKQGVAGLATPLRSTELTPAENK
jgi:hypothetical protein